MLSRRLSQRLFAGQPGKHPRNCGRRAALRELVGAPTWAQAGRCGPGRPSRALAKSPVAAKHARRRAFGRRCRRDRPVGPGRSWKHCGHAAARSVGLRGPALWSFWGTAKAMQCSSCLATLPEAAKFCIECGAPAPSVCAGCGFANLGHANFCAECGAKLTSPESDEAPNAPPPATGRSPRSRIRPRSSGGS